MLPNLKRQPPISGGCRLCFGQFSVVIWEARVGLEESSESRRYQVRLFARGKSKKRLRQRRRGRWEGWMWEAVQRQRLEGPTGGLHTANSGKPAAPGPCWSQAQTRPSPHPVRKGPRSWQKGEPPIIGSGSSCPYFLIYLRMLNLNRVKL